MISREEAERLVAKHGGVRAAAKAIGMPRTTFRDALDRDPATSAAMSAVGTGMTPRLVWAKTKNDDGTSYSVLLKPNQPGFTSLLDEIKETIRTLETDHLTLPPRFVEREGSMLVLDPADVHIGKLSVASETGHTYDSGVAEHRLVEGSRVLAEQGAANGATRVLFVIGNDIAHFDNAKSTTTSGTHQDSDTSIFEVYRAAHRAYVGIVRMLLEMDLGVTIVFNPSNHDWVLGFTIAQSIQAVFREHPNVDVSDYAVSEMQRKYVRFGSSLLGFTHGGDSKQADLSQLMLREAQSHVAACPHLYWYMHHYHHKVRKAEGIRPFAREKDHIAMTVIGSGPGAMEGDNVNVEIVRSPSAPDGWHARNGYLNRQAVEAFLHHPLDGQIARFTAWY